MTGAICGVKWRQKGNVCISVLRVIKITPMITAIDVYTVSYGSVRSAQRYILEKQKKNGRRIMEAFDFVPTRTMDVVGFMVFIIL